MSTQHTSTRERSQPDATPGSLGRNDRTSQQGNSTGDQPDRGKPKRQQDRPDEIVTDDKGNKINSQDGNDTPRNNPEINPPIYDPGTTEQKIPKM